MGLITTTPGAQMCTDSILPNGIIDGSRLVAGTINTTTMKPTIITTIGDLLGITRPTTPAQLERYLINIEEKIKRQQKQIAAVRKFKEALDGLNII